MMELVPAKFAPFAGRVYERPHGCFRLVQAVYEELYDALPDYAYGLREDDYNTRAAMFYEYLTQDAVKVDKPIEGDVIVINVGGNPYHMGVVVAPGVMLHAFEGANACIEPYNDLKYRSRIEGFYRRKGACAWSN